MKTDKIKYKFLLLVPYSYPDYSGSGRNAFNFGKFLVKKGIPVNLITLNRNLQYKKREQIEGLNIHRIAYLNRNLFLKIISLLWILPVYFIKICECDIIYIYGKNLIAWQSVILFSRIARKKVIFRSLIFGEDDVMSILSSKKNLNRAIHIYLIKHVDCYYAIHPGFSAEYFKAGGSDLKLLEIPQGVDTDVFHPVSSDEKKSIRKKLGFPEADFIIISVAFLIDRKGFDEIFEQLHKVKHPFRYIIIGEHIFNDVHFLLPKQEEAKRLRKKGEDLLGSRLHLAGPCENINEYLQVSDVCLFNSRAEGLPNSMLEAMACGITVITNPIAGLTGYLLNHNKNALIFSKPEDLNSLIEMLYNDNELGKYMGDKAAETIRNIGTYDTILRMILNKLKIE